MSKYRKHHDQEALFRFSVIAPLINETVPRGKLRSRFKKLADKHYKHPTRGYEKYSHRTVEDWYYNYISAGMSGLESKRRSDYQTSRAIDDDVGKLILDMKKENPKRSVPQILRELQMANVISRKQISRATVYRYLKANETELVEFERDKKQKRKYSFAHSNECWQSDVKHGPHLHIEGYAQRKKVYLFGFLDDASRIIPHVQFVLKEDMDNFLHTFKSAVQKKGIPERMYLDNASYYRSPVVKTIGARLGCRVMYATPYAPYQKGKIERWWRTCDEQFLSYLDREKHYKLEGLNSLLSEWVEKEYHHRKHSSLKTSPIEAWQEKQNQIVYPTKQQLQQDFLAEDTRKVRSDGTISFNSIYYEVDSTLAGQQVTVRFDPVEDNKELLVYWQGKLLGKARPVNEVDNRFAGRKKNMPANQPVDTGIDYLNLIEKEMNKDV
jgi:transposase InsO family protein